MSGPSNLQDAITAWHDGLTPEVAAESSGWLTEQLQRRGLFFGERPLCTVLRPRFLTIELSVVSFVTGRDSRTNQG